MSNKRRIIANLPLVISDADVSNSLSSVPNVINIEMYYSLGGMNHFTSQNEGRGIYISVSPLKKGGGFTTYSSFSGIKCNIKPLKRFSQKALEDAVIDRYLFSSMVNEVLTKNSINLTPEGNEQFKELLKSMPVAESQVA